MHNFSRVPWLITLSVGSFSAVLWTFLTMMYPGMLDFLPEPPISPEVRMYLRMAAYFGVAVAIYYYGTCWICRKS